MVFLGSHSVEGRLDPGRSTAAYWVRSGCSNRSAWTCECRVWFGSLIGAG